MTNQWKVKTLLITWDSQGLESIIDVDAEQGADVWNAFNAPFGATTSTLMTIINVILMRARCNPQRHYEVYCIEISEYLSIDDIRSMFKDTPQAAADLIRDRGRKIFSNRADRAAAIV